ncbi:MAG: hypothetical protein CMC82_08945 [Flavobacteriaceae bacterium]|nr:hypothetical protein [Flavobacteriaceae bacterium]
MNIIKFNTTNFFLFSLILASVLPLVVLLITYKFPLTFGSIGIFPFLILLGSTHVFGTSYLFFDRDVRNFFIQNPFKMILVPLLLFSITVYLISNTDGDFFIYGALGYLIYQTWHFGAQNIGVLSFISISTRKKSISVNEKRFLKICAIIGMIGVSKIRETDLGISSKYINISGEFQNYIDLFYEFGMILFLLSLFFIMYHVFQMIKKQHYFYALGFFICSTFLFTMYVSKDLMIGYGAFAAAHGLQYLVFLFFHSFNNVKKNHITFKSFYPIIALICILFVAKFLWENGSSLDEKFDDFALLGMSIILGITVVHFWIDQYIWQMKNPDRRKWLKKRFDFILTKN